METKIPDYMERGDREIWRLHQVDRTLTTWVLQPDGRDIETLDRHGGVRAAALPGVQIDLDDLFAD